MSINFNEVKKELLKNPEFKKEYEDLSSEYRIARMLIMTRLKSGLTQQEVAERMGTSQSAVARMESGKLGNLKTIEKYAEATGNRITFQIQRVASNK